MSYLPQVDLVFQMQVVHNLEYYTFGFTYEMHFFHRPKYDKALYWLCSRGELLYCISEVMSTVCRQVSWVPGVAMTFHRTSFKKK